MGKNQSYYLVREDVLSESMIKVLEAKQLLDRGDVQSVTQAVKKVGLSRSAFYKYREGIFPFRQVIQENIITVLVRLEDQKGSLMNVLDLIAKAGCNVLTIHQTIPLDGVANVTLSLETGSMKEDFNRILKEIRQLPSVSRVDIIGSGGYSK